MYSLSGNQNIEDGSALFREDARPQDLKQVAVFKQNFFELQNSFHVKELAYQLRVG